MTAITIELPDDVARSAQQAGLLASQTLASTVQELVRQTAAKKIVQAFAAFDSNLALPVELSQADIQLAIHAARGHWR